MRDGSTARAFVPGHVTGLFTVHRTDDPTTTGSRGAGFTLADGVTVSVQSTSDTSVTLDGDTTEINAVSGVLDVLDVNGTVEIDSDLPVGMGFGLSGGMALGTALASNEVFQLSYTMNELVRFAHVADVEAGTGLGDVVAQARGGIVLRLEPGAPPHGRLDDIPGEGRVEYLALGELSTPEVLADHPETITRAGTRALETLRSEPTRNRFVETAGQFSEEVGLMTPRVTSIVETVESAGGEASMAMLGETVYGFGHALSDAGFEPEVSTIDHCGASLSE